MGAQKKDMVKDTGYKVVSDNKIQQVKMALYEGDYGYMANILSHIKLNRKQFFLLCKECIEIRKISALKILLEAYSIFWSQELFDELVKYTVEEKYYEILSFLDGYIDRANEYNRKVNEWNDYVKKKQENREKGSKSRFIQWIRNLFHKKV